MKKSILIVILTVAFSVSQAQSTAYVEIAGKGFLEKIERVSTGGYITVGYDSNYKTQIVKWDDQFNPVWKHKFTDSRVLGISKNIVEANDGSFYFMTASSEYTGSTLIIKFSSTGSILWQKIYYVTTGNLNSIALSKAAGSDNGFLFGGGQCALTNYIIKCDASGSIEWQKQYYYPLASGVITCWSIIPEGSGYVVSSGYNINSLLTFKMDLSGTVTSHTAYTYTGMQILPTRIIKLSNSGGYAIVGNYNSSNNNKTEFVAFYNSALSLLSFNELTVTYTQFTLWDIAAINNGKNVILVGSIYQDPDFYNAMINVSSNGNVVWKKMAEGNSPLSNKNVELRGITTKGNNTVSVGSGFNEGCFAAIIDTNGNGFCNDVAFDLVNNHRTLVLQSSTITPVSSTALSSTVNYTSETNVTTSKYVYCGSLSSLEDYNMTSDNFITIYPNPANDKITVETGNIFKSSGTTVSIFDITGREIFREEIKNTSSLNSHNFEVSNFPEGIYILKFSDNVSETFKKFIISR